MINEIFEEIKKEARTGIVKLKDEDGEFPLRTAFNVVDDIIYKNIPNIYIRDKERFNNVLIQYVSSVLDFYSLEPTRDSVKKIIAYSFSNITETDMYCFENYLNKYIKFYNTKFNIIAGEKETSLGTILYKVEKQSIMQETPYCFKSHLEKNNSRYSLPRISFGINDDICEIYAIQNKDSIINTDPNYNKEVKEAFRTINSGISKYRNVTPSFVITLILFLSFLKQNDIHKIKVVTPLPIRQANRSEVQKIKINDYLMKGTLDKMSVDTIKKSFEQKLSMDEYNSTVKFVNCFNRLKLHFENLFYVNINNQMIIDILNLSTDNQLLREIVKEKEIDINGKISKYSSC